MFQWIEKLQPQQDWITIIMILVFALCVYLYKRNPHQFKLLVLFGNPKPISIFMKKKSMSTP